MRKRYIKHTLMLAMVIIYAIVALTYSLFPKSELNRLLSQQILLAQFYSFALFFSTIIAIFSLAFMIKSLLKKRKSTKSTMIWLIMVLISIILMIFGSDSKTGAVKNSSNQQFDSLKIVEYNSGNNLSSDNIQKIFGEFNTDIAVLPEFDDFDTKTSSANMARIEHLFRDAKVDINNYNVFISNHPAGIAGVTIIVKKQLADFTQLKDEPHTTFETVTLHSKTKEMPDIIGLHSAPPIPGKLMNYWKQDLVTIKEKITQENPNAIIIGDFNANMRHGELNDIQTHEDALLNLSKFSRGTWPAKKLPSLFRTSIDHVLLPKNQYEVNQIELKDLGSSDHMALFVEVKI